MRRNADRLCRVCRAKNTHREKALRQAEICQGNSSPEGGNHGHHHLIELGFIGIIIIITNTFIIIITMQSRCNILG
jgi:hypothetical protein